MAKSQIWKLGLALVLLATLTALACSPPGSGGPSKEAVGKAIVAMESGWDYVYYDGTYAGPAGGPYTSTPTAYTDPSGGTVSAAYTSSTDPATGDFAIDGVVTFSNFHESLTGYTINGTMSVGVTSNVSLVDFTSYPQTLSVTCTCDLALSGGDISKLTGSYRIDMTFTSFGTGNYTGSGTIYADGYALDIGELMAH